MSAETDRPPTPALVPALTMVGDAAAAPVCDGDICWVPEAPDARATVDDRDRPLS